MILFSVFPFITVFSRLSADLRINTGSWREFCDETPQTFICSTDLGCKDKIQVCQEKWPKKLFSRNRRPEQTADWNKRPVHKTKFELNTRGVINWEIRWVGLKCLQSNLSRNVVVYERIWTIKLWLGKIFSALDLWPWLMGGGRHEGLTVFQSSKLF